MSIKRVCILLVASVIGCVGEPPIDEPDEAAEATMELDAEVQNIEAVGQIGGQPIGSEIMYKPGPDGPDDPEWWRWWKWPPPPPPDPREEVILDPAELANQPALIVR